MPLISHRSSAPVSASVSDQSSSDQSSNDSFLGTLYGIGVGPGDPELITLKALKRLQAAPVVAFPAGLKGKPGVAERIVEPWLSPDQTRLSLEFPYVVEMPQLVSAWHRAAEVVWPYLQQGDVVFACEGDVSFYGTFTYLAQCLRQQHPTVKIEVIAGVSSPMAAAAALGIPLTCQAERMVVLPALYDVYNVYNDSAHDSLNPNGDDKTNADADLSPKVQRDLHALETALSWAEVVVLMKVGSVYTQVWAMLDRYQLLARSYVVENATRPEQKIYTDLRNYPNLKLSYFSLLIVQSKGHFMIESAIASALRPLPEP